MKEFKMAYCGKDLPVYGDYDVIVAGAGLSGVAAAIRASRQGSRTLLIERTGMLGGVATSSLMSSSTNFFFTHDNKQVVKGIPEEIFEMLVKRGIVPQEWKTSTLTQLPYDADVLQSILYELLLHAGARILLHTYITDVIINDGEDERRKHINGLVIENKSGRQAVVGRMIVDCSGDADIVHYSDLPTRCNRDAFSLSLLYEMGSVDLQKTYEYYRDHREDYNEEMDIAMTFSQFEQNWLQMGVFHLPHGVGVSNSLLQNAIAKEQFAKTKGLANGLDALGLYGIRKSQKVTVNSNFFSVNPIDDIENLSRAEMEGRERCLELGELLKLIMPGFEHSYISRMASQIGTRLTRSVIGKYEIKEDDYLTARKFNDAVCNTIVVNKISNGCKITDKIFGIPFSALITNEIDNLIIGSGKSISADFILRSMFFRGQIPTMQIGETAGAAASIAAKQGNDLQTIDLDQLRTILGFNVYW